MPLMVEFRILGPLEVVEHDRQLVLGSPKQRALLAVLLVHRGESEGCPDRSGSPGRQQRW
jgi:DNA-binding SARP family transcriptional activator